MYIAISILILLLSYHLFEKASGSMSISKLNMISFIFYVPLVLQSFIGSLLIIHKADDDPIINMFVNNVPYDIRLFGWLAVLYTMVMMPIGMLAANKLFNVKSARILLGQYINGPIVNLTSPRDSHIRFPLYVLTIISIVTILYTYLNLKHIPWLGLFSGFDAMMLAALREEAGNDFGGNAFIRQIFGNMMTPILAYVSYSYWKITKSKKDRIWFYVMFFMTFLILTHSLAKAPFIMFLFGFLFLTAMIEGKIKTSTLLIIPTICLVLLILIYFFIMGLTSGSTLFFKPGSGLVWRIVVTQIVGLYGALAVFPFSHPHIDFVNTSSALSSIFGVESIEPSAKIVMRFITPEGVEQGMAGYANSLFIGEAWAHYGIAGVLMAPFYVGFIIQLCYVTLLKQKKSPIYLAIFTFLSYKWAVASSFFYFVVNPDLMIIFIIIISTIYFAHGSYYTKRVSMKF